MADVPVRLKTTYDDKGTRAAKKDFQGIEKSAKALGGAIIAAFGTQQIIEFGRESLNLAREQALAEAQLAQVIESTGNVAGVTADEMRELASRLQDVTNFGDEATISAQALLLTFTNIGGEVLPDATKIVLDMSQALGQDLRTSALQLGKALNDPISGITALTRAGVQFTDEQEELIKSLVETGRTAEAQAVILEELNTQFGGSAAAAREAAGGSVALGNAYGDLQEQAGFLLGDILGLNDGMENQIAIVDTTSGRISVWRQNLQQADIVLDALAEKLGLADDGMTKFGDAVIAVNKGIATFFLGPLVDEIGLFADEVEERADEIVSNQEEAAQESNAIAEESGAALVATGQETNEELIDLQRDLATDLIDIGRDADEARLDQAADFADDIADLERDHASEITDIQKDAAKERAKIDSDLAKNLAKSTKSTQDRVRKEQEKFAKDDKNQRRREAVDTLGDQRLFDFQLQKLARDGQATAIQDALQQRTIEEEIAREKGAVEADIERESRQDRINTIREEGAERRSQLQDDANEEKRLFEEGLSEELAAEQANFAQRQADLDRFNQEALEEINEAETAKIAAVGEGLAEIEGLTVGNFDTLLGVAETAGPEIGEALAAGMTQGFMDNFNISQLAGVESISPGQEFTGPTGTGSVFGFQAGGSFTVGGQGGPDSQLVQFAATPGEQVTVSPPGENGGPSLTINFNGPVSDPAQFAGMIQSAFDQFASALGASP
jgi:hypothetical protein